MPYSIYIARTAPTLYTYHTDAQGNVVALTNAVGTIVETFKYDVYGRMTAVEAWDGSSKTTVNDGDSSGFIEFDEYATVSIIDNVILFQSRRLDGESGLYYFRNRYYDPETGRFLSRDPKGFVDGPNLYAFVNNNPINYVDPYGTNTLAVGPVETMGLGWGQTTSWQVATDDLGNVGVLLTKGDGWYVGGGASMGIATAMTNAPTIFDLEGPGEQTGASMGAGIPGTPFSVSGGVEHIQAGRYEGFEFTVSLSVGGPIDVHRFNTESFLYYLGNYKQGDKSLEELKEMAAERIKKMQEEKKKKKQKKPSYDPRISHGSIPSSKTAEYMVKNKILKPAPSGNPNEYEDARMNVDMSSGVANVRMK